jgi:outer membrane protein TolC
MRKILFLLITSCLTAATRTGAQTDPLTLQQAVTVALERNPQRKAALAEVRAARSFIREAQSGYFPQLSFSETAVRSNDPVFVFGTRLRQTRFTAPDFALDRLNTPAPVGNFATRFGLQWKVFDSFATSAGVRQAAREKSAFDQRLARAEQAIVFRVIQAYYGALFAARQLELAEHTATTSQSVLEQSRARFEGGSTVESDFLAAQVNHASRQQELIRARNALALARAQLNLAMGVAPDHDYQTSEPSAALELKPPALAEAESRALKERPDLKESTEQVAAQEAGIQSAKSAFGPRVNVFAASELDSVNLFGNGGNNWTAGAELQFDIFTGGQKSARLARARANFDAAQAMKQVAADGIRLDVRRAWYDFDSARQMVEVSRGAAAQSEEALRIVSNRYQAGMTTITEMLRAEDAAHAAHNSYWEAVYRCGTSYAALELAMGTLTPQSRVVMP